jgi:hypothetical protein
MLDSKKVAEELAWLVKNKHFKERPATLLEFLGPRYLNVESLTRAAIKDVLSEVMGEEVNGERPTQYPLAMFTGAIGIGKTTVAAIVLPYLVHWTLCLKDPQGHFSLLPGSRIAFMQMSTSESQAREVLFGDIKARIAHSPWFQTNYPPDPKFKNQIRFDKDIWILPGDSSETTFEGYNILGGILDEMDSHKVTKNKDYAQTGYDTISARIASRFEDRGFLMLIGQMKKATGFANTKYEEFLERPDAYVARLTLWESLGWDHYEKDEDGNAKSFFYDPKRKIIIPDGVIETMTESDQVMEIPELFRNEFKNNPEKALRDLAGIPPHVGDAFIGLIHKVEEARDRWIERSGVESPVDPRGRIAKWFRAPDTLKRVGHLDIAYSGDGDALGFAMGHVREMVDIEGELKPYIIIDMLYRMRAPSGSEIMLADIRHMIYSLKEDFGFKLEKVTMDGFESTDTKQQFRRRKIHSDILSVDRDILPYHDLREAIYENRIEFPPYLVNYHAGDTKMVEILVKELQELVDEGKKIDHPANGSKDVADAVAGVCNSLMGDRRYHKRVVRIDSSKQQRQSAGGNFQGQDTHHAFTGLPSPKMPIPPPIPRRD